MYAAHQTVWCTCGRTLLGNSACTLTRKIKRHRKIEIGGQMKIVNWWINAIFAHDASLVRRYVQYFNYTTKTGTLWEGRLSLDLIFIWIQLQKWWSSAQRCVSSFISSTCNLKNEPFDKNKVFNAWSLRRIWPNWFPGISKKNLFLVLELGIAGIGKIKVKLIGFGKYRLITILCSIFLTSPKNHKL